jgi:hypothetical protein
MPLCCEPHPFIVGKRQWHESNRHHGCRLSQVRFSQEERQRRSKSERWRARYSVKMSVANASERRKETGNRSARINPQPPGDVRAGETHTTRKFPSTPAPPMLMAARGRRRDSDSTLVAKLRLATRVSKLRFVSRCGGELALTQRVRRAAGAVPARRDIQTELMDMVEPVGVSARLTVTYNCGIQIQRSF